MADTVFERDEEFFWCDDDGEEQGPYVTHAEAQQAYTDYCQWLNDGGR